MNKQASALHDVLSYEDFHEKETEFVKVAGTYLHPAELGWLYDRKQYIVKYRSIYKIDYSRNYKGGYYTRLIYKAEKSLTKRGCLDYASADEVNKMLGFELLSTEVY